MNTGIQDGYNLAWKLALVLRGKTSIEILTSYDEERLPNAETLTKRPTASSILWQAQTQFWLSREYIFFRMFANLAFKLDVVKNFLFPRISQIGINYREGPLSEDHGYFNIKAGDRMPYLRLRVRACMTVCAILNSTFSCFDGTEMRPDLPEDFEKQWGDLVDFHLVSLTRKFGRSSARRKSFLVLLRPDNYIGLISDEVSFDETREVPCQNFEVDVWVSDHLEKRRPEGTALEVRGEAEFIPGPTKSTTRQIVRGGRRPCGGEGKPFRGYGKDVSLARLQSSKR